MSNEAASAGVEPAGAPPASKPTSRRAALLGGAAAIGAAIAATTGNRAEADNGKPVLQGAQNIATESTELQYPTDLSTTPRTHAFAVTDGLWGRVPPSANDPETGFRSAIFGWSGNDAMIGVGGITSAGVPGAAGGKFHGESPQAYGLIASGRRATLRLKTPNDGTPTAPPDRADFHNAGEITIDDRNDIWVCVKSGNPGQWMKLAGAATAGSYHPITPARVFDSRIAAIPSSGKFRANTNRTIDVRNGYDVETGKVVARNVVPPGATAITYNLTVTNTDGPGYVFLAPGNATKVTASSINYSAPGTTIANGGTVKLDSQRRLKAFCAVGGTDVIVDVTGYYR